MAIVGVLLVTGFAACTKELVVEPLPLAGFTVYDAVPVRAVNLPSGGVAMLCKRSIDDPVLASALVFDAQGALMGRMDFGQLPGHVENITFGPEDWYVTDLVPMDDGTFMVISLGRQRELDDRLHLLIHRVTASGASIMTPIRRYVTDHGALVRAEDIDQLYRTTARAALRTTLHLVVTVRYDRQEGTIIQAYHRSFQVGLAAGAGSYGLPAIPLAAPEHALWHVVADGQGGSLHIMDTTNTGGPGNHLLVKRIQWGAQFMEGTEQGTLQLRDAEPHAAMMANGELILAGAYQVAADVRRPFFSRSSGPAAESTITYPDLGAGDRSALFGALAPVGGGFVAMGNVYEQQVVSVRAMREDRFCDLNSAKLNPDGTVQESRTVISGKGLRVLGAWGPEGELVAGAFHPFLNTDYMHGFVASTTP